ncbi:MAG: 7TM-DISM domain-containing protein [Burkholderiaceae bacterium]|nr:7TM-DISM domain-containing protein [Burkholderiaceae bacterium]
MPFRPLFEPAPARPYAPFPAAPRTWRGLATLLRRTGLWGLGLLLLAFACLGNAARAESDLIRQRAYIEDPEGKMSLEDVHAADTWKPFQGPLPLRNKGTPFWIRLDVQSPPTAENWVLSILPGVLQDAQVFQRNTQGQWQVQKVGNRYAYHQRERSELAYTVLYRTDYENPSTIYVRVRTDSSLAHFQVVSATESRDYDTRLHVMIGLYVGFGVVVMCISVLTWRITRHRLWGVSAVFDFVTFALLTFQLGVISKYLLPDTEGVVDQMVLVVNGLHLFVGCVLYRGMFRLFRSPAWCSWGYTLVFLLYPVQLVLILRGQGAQAMALNNLEILMISLWGGVAAWFAPIEDKVLNYLFKFSNAVVTIYLLLWVAPVLFKVQIPTALSLYPALPSNFFTMLMTLAIMARHTQLETQRQRLIERQKQESDLALTYEKQRHAETNGFLSMVMHELKNPLSLLRVGTKNLELDTAPAPEARAARFAKIQRAIESIDAILERCVEVDHLEQGTLSVQPHDEDITELLTECVEQTSAPHRIVLHLMPRAHAYVDGVLLRLMVRNLLDNALRYGAQDAPVTLRLAQTDKALLITVSNPPGRGGRPDPDKLFRKYYRAPSALFASGTGLGLYWVSQVSQLMNTTVRYIPDEHLVIFELCLPN